jgi:Pyruvate/2-oxoacid:ferredoxin oxidoreductase delta subunit
MAKRNIVEIDEAKCDGCGLCVPSCAEGAIQIVDGKARLVSDVYCDGLGACLGTCPQDAIRIVQREAKPFDEHAARRHVQRAEPVGEGSAASAVCPGSAARDLRLATRPAGPPQSAASGADQGADAPASALGNWPVQLRLVPPNAPFLRDSDLLLAADCVAFAYADFHRQFLQGRPVVIGCPKLDDAPAYVDKLADIVTQSSIRSITILHMEVPCCTGLVRIAAAAIAQSGRNIPLNDATISIRGELLGPVSRPDTKGKAADTSRV